MAWTRSTPQRGNFVVADRWFGAIGPAQVLSRGKERRAPYASGRERAALAAAALLIVTALAIVLLSEVVAALIGVAGLALAIQPNRTERVIEILKRFDKRFDMSERESMRCDAPSIAIPAVPLGASVPSVPRYSCTRPAVMADMIDASADNCEAAQLDLAQWSKLTSHMSHELRTPLNAVLGFSELLSSEALGPVGVPVYAEYARAINESGRQLLKTAEDALAITSVLTGSAHDRRKHRAYSLRALVDEALTFHGESLTRHSAILQIDIEDGIDIEADPQVMRQVLINALDVMMSAGKGHGPLETRVFAARESRSVVFEVYTRPLLVHDDASSQSDAHPATDFSLLLLNTLCQISGVTVHHATECHGEMTVKLAIPCNQQSDLFAAAL